jgi:hypothetical protein
MTKRDRTLLVVDWDFWFRNPLEACDRRAEDTAPLLYDWGHRETRFFIHDMWPMRAAAFVRHGLPLPGMEPGWQTFAQRFQLSRRAVVHYQDSNAGAGLVQAPRGSRWADVWLYDAHHDCYRSGGDLMTWTHTHLQPGGALRFTCEDWMFVHAVQGSRLHWRYPAFRHDRKAKAGADHEALPHKSDEAFWRKFSSAQDAGHNGPEQEIDAVFVCRSGAWVPPWCDNDLQQFLDSFGRRVVRQDAEPVVRPFSLDAVHAEVERWRAMEQEVRP